MVTIVLCLFSLTKRLPLVQISKTGLSTVKSFSKLGFENEKFIPQAKILRKAKLR